MKAINNRPTFLLLQLCVTMLLGRPLAMLYSPSFVPAETKAKLSRNAAVYYGLGWSIPTGGFRLGAVSTC